MATFDVSGWGLAGEGSLITAEVVRSLSRELVVLRLLLLLTDSPSLCLSVPPWVEGASS